MTLVQTFALSAFEVNCLLCWERAGHDLSCDCKFFSYSRCSGSPWAVRDTKPDRLENIDIFNKTPCWVPGSVNSLTFTATVEDGKKDSNWEFKLKSLNDKSY